MIQQNTGNEEESTRIVEQQNTGYEEAADPTPPTNDDTQIPEAIPVAPRSKKSGAIWIVLFIVLLLGAAGGGAYYYFFIMNDKTEQIENDEEEEDSDENDSREVDETEENEICGFITRMYNSRLYNNDEFLERHCSERLLKKLQEDYDYDCDGTCYATWDFRLYVMEGHPEREVEDHVIQTISQGNGWYTYEFYDSGFRGINRVKAYIKDDEVILDAIENVYNEADDYYAEVRKKEHEHYLSLFEEDGSRTLNGSLLNNNGDWESITIEFYQEDGDIVWANYKNTGAWGENRYTSVSLYGNRTSNGYHFYCNDEELCDMEIVITQSEPGYEGYTERYGTRNELQLYYSEE